LNNNDVISHIVSYIA